jgi:hypothetical protein
MVAAINSELVLVVSQPDKVGIHCRALRVGVRTASEQDGLLDQECFDKQFFFTFANPRRGFLVMRNIKLLSSFHLRSIF